MHVLAHHLQQLVLDLKGGDGEAFEVAHALDQEEQALCEDAGAFADVQALQFLEVVQEGDQRTAGDLQAAGKVQLLDVGDAGEEGN